MKKHIQNTRIIKAAFDFIHHVDIRNYDMWYDDENDQLDITGNIYLNGIEYDIEVALKSKPKED